MISKKLVLILSLCVAGSFVPLQASVCAASGTLNTYIGTTCSDATGAISFTFTSWAQLGLGSTPAGGIPATSVTLQMVSNANGVGFELTPIGAWSATGGGYTDGELRYSVTATGGITSLYQEIDGTVIPHAFDDIDDNFCLGSTSLPPGTPCLTTTGVAGGTVQTIHSTIVGVGDSAPLYSDSNNGNNSDGCAAGSEVGALAGCATTKLFSSVNSIAVQKDIRGDTSYGDAASGGANASITAVYNQFGVTSAVPEPGTYVLSFIGLGLLFLGNRKYSRS